MGNKGKEGQSSQRQLNDYETSRMLRIQENQGKLQQFGLKNIAKSLTSLVESQSLKKRKGKPKVTDEKDEEYIPDFGTDNEENCEEETSKSVKVHKKVHPTQYIAPMSMNKYANLARRRMTAHSAPHVVQSEEGTHLVGSDVTKKSKKYIGTNTTQQNQPRANMSMGELILNKKASQNQPRANMSMGEQILNKKASQNQPRENMSIGGLILNKKTSQKQAGVLEPNVVNPSSSKRSTLSGARRKLFVVDNNDVSFQDMNVADGYRDYDEDDENEDIDNTILRNEIEGNGRISQGNELLEMEDDEIDQLISEDDNQQDGLKDDLEMEEDEMDQLISEDDDNRQDGLEYDLEMEDDEPAQEQIITYSTKATAISNTKKRGPTMLHKIHTRSIDERQVIICNEFGQPIGPVVNGENIAGKFSRFLGTIARNHRLASLTHASWHKVPSKEKMWEYVLKKYIVPKEAKDWVLRSIGASWRLHKCRIKSKHFYKYKDNKSRLNNRPKYLTEKDFAMLLRFWSNKETMERCSLARDRRLSQKNNHTAGPKSFAMIREELVICRP
ncbi:hypothetical protein SSX86_003865 [Deinandra increscens subsp. villosa]|uniref:Transposase n=1 Tax=Deinandra increscens subsp. villosa TaxID=3103831 RepID=A0AAP0HAD0_9ASTR